MKIIHCADLHLDAKMTSNLTKEQARERKMEILRTFSHMVDYAASNEVRCILIAGDLFDTRNVSATARNTVRDAIISHPEIDFLYLRGNHDNDNFLSKLEEIPENLNLFSDQWAMYQYGDICLAGIELSPDNQAEVYNALVLPHDTFNIVTLHGQLSGYAIKDKAEMISLDQLRNKNIDYLALGHVHNYQSDKLDARGIYCYCGCPEGRGFDECGEKGFVVLDIDENNHTMTRQFVKAATRTLYTLEVDVSGVLTTNEAARKVEEELNRTHYPASSLVKIVLTGEVDVECEINIDYMQELFCEYFYFLKMENQTRYMIRFEDYEKDESLKGEFIRMVLSSDIPQDKQSEVIRMGLAALAGEEI